jgi:transposase
METTIEIQVTRCDVCGEDLSFVACEHIEKRTKIDIMFEKVVEHVEAQVKVCPSCDATVKGQFPSDMPGALQYGNGLKAYVINLIIGQMVSLNRVQKLVQSMIGEMLSQTTFLKFIVRLYEALEAWEMAAVEQVLKRLNAESSG